MNATERALTRMRRRRAARHAAIDRLDKQAKRLLGTEAYRLRKAQRLTEDAR